MDSSLLTKEIKWLQDYYSKQCFDPLPLNKIDLSLIYDYYPSTEFLTRLICAFAPLIENITNTKYLTPLTFNFFETDKVINDRIAVVKYIHDKSILFLLKQEEHGKETDNLIHEFFVGINILNILPTFTSVITCYSCTPYIKGKASHCEYVGSANENDNFILYQYIDGPTLYKAIEDKIVTLQEAWQIIKIVYESVKYAYEKKGFIHQDLHFGNIILVDLGQKMNVKINMKVYTTKFLPKIIDYARAQIKVGRDIYSPKSEGLMIPAKNHFHDLRYLFWSWYDFDNEFFQFLGKSPVGDFPTWYIIQLLNMKDSTLKLIYDKYDRKYSYINDPYLPVIEMAEDTETEVDNPPFSEKKPIPEDLQEDFELKSKSYKALDRIELLFYKLDWEYRVFRTINQYYLIDILKLINKYKLKMENYYDSKILSYYKSIGSKKIADLQDQYKSYFGDSADFFFVEKKHE